MLVAREEWSYDRERRLDQLGVRWHFATRSVHDDALPYEDRPYELYFRNDDRSQFGVLRFARRKDNPYRDYDLIVWKIMNNSKFREQLLDPSTADVWQKSWK